MSDILKDSSSNPIEFFRVRSEETKSKSSKANNTRAIDSLEGFVGGMDLRFDSFNSALIEEWVASQLFAGYAPQTVSYNVKKIGALYNKAVEEGLAQPVDVFAEMQTKLNDSGTGRFEGMTDKDTFDKLQKIVRTDYSSSQEKQLAKDLLLFAVYNGGLTFEQLEKFGKADYKGENVQIKEIVSRYADPKRKYLFPLDQSKLTARQRQKKLEELFYDVLWGADLKLSPRTGNTALDLWCLCAMSCGVPAREIAACVAPRIGSSAVTAFVTPAEISEDRVGEIRNLVIETLSYNPLRWFAMHFRRRVDYDMIQARMKAVSLTPVETYYPMEEIIKKVGKKKIFESKPVISWLLFFRGRVTELPRLYYNIGDLAWGYRRSPEPGSPYAIISEAAIREYKQALGTIDSDVEILSDEEVEFHEGDYMIVLGGNLNGRPATIDSIVKSRNKGKGGKTIYRLKLSGGNNANWIVEREPKNLRKITEAQYTRLLTSAP